MARVEDAEGRLIIDRLRRAGHDSTYEVDSGERNLFHYRCPGRPHRDAEMPLVLVHYPTTTQRWDVRCSESCKFVDIADGLGLEVSTATEQQVAAGATREPDERKSAATMLVEIAEELYDFGISADGDTFGVPRSGPKLVRMVRGGGTSLRAQLAREHFRRLGRTASQQALTDALAVVEGIAADGAEQRLDLRVARRDGALWLDLGDATGRAVRVTGSGWSVEPTAPVLFRRSVMTAALPEPQRGGGLADLWRWLNVTEADRPLVAAWLVAVLFADVPHTVLSIFGEQGSGKSTAAKVLVGLLDPNPAALRKPPRDAESWVTAASGSWVVGLDNLSTIADWLSDSFCRAVTGDADVRRRLYTDGEHALFAFRRCLVLNGIDVGTVRGDLAERMLPIHLTTISERERRGEEDIWPAWEREHPRLLGALLDLTARVLAALPTVELERRPRMADFARVLAAVDQVLGTDGLGRYLAKQGEAAVDSLTGDPFITAVAAQFAGQTFVGTAGELLKAMSPFGNVRPGKGWPTTARLVTTALRRQAPTMRKAGWSIEDDDASNHDKVIRWTITPPPPATCRVCGHRLDPALGPDGLHPLCAEVVQLAETSASVGQKCG
ncbi:hypothetical protein [Geodermatophilus sp. CPCC 205761]|uniref:hypothetical protein n=1 Tax=Geodermatophilus sp. CPCC 205761 TaxID=2936597 RepID=UPI003EE9DDA1